MNQLFQAQIDRGSDPVVDPAVALVVVHAVWPTLAFSAEEVEHRGDGVWLIPVPADLVSSLLVVGFARHLEIPGVGAITVDIPTT